MFPLSLTYKGLCTITLTSIHDGGVAVEDQPALVQSRDRVQQVKSPQVPLVLLSRIETGQMDRDRQTDTQTQRLQRWKLTRLRDGEEKR